MMSKRTLALVSLFTFTGAACGTNTDTPQPMGPEQCGTAEYIAFDPANHQNQDIRVQAYTQMIALMNEAKENPSLSMEKFTEAERLYIESASLQEKVQGRQDDHFTDARADVGMALDMAIMEGFAQGKTSTTSLGANLAKQKVDKTLIHFLYLSVFHEMVLGAKSKWDEAYGYYGAPSDNSEGARMGLAAVATKRDGNNNTNLAQQIFNNIVDGACELAKALETSGGTELNYLEVPALKQRVDAADEAMQQVLAYSVGHEAFDMVNIQGDLSSNPTQELRDTMWVKLAEIDPYFKPIEVLMLDKGGDSADRAMRLRQQIDAAWADPSGDWMTTFDAQGTIDDLEAEFNIDIKG